MRTFLAYVRFVAGCIVCILAFPLHAYGIGISPAVRHIDGVLAGSVFNIEVVITRPRALSDETVRIDLDGSAVSYVSGEEYVHFEQGERSVEYILNLDAQTMSPGEYDIRIQATQERSSDDEDAQTTEVDLSVVSHISLTVVDEVVHDISLVSTDVRRIDDEYVFVYVVDNEGNTNEHFDFVHLSFVNVQSNEEVWESRIDGAQLTAASPFDRTTVSLPLDDMDISEGVYTVRSTFRTGYGEEIEGVQDRVQIGESVGVLGGNKNRVRVIATVFLAGLCVYLVWRLAYRR